LSKRSRSGHACAFKLRYEQFLADNARFTLRYDERCGIGFRSGQLHGLSVSSRLLSTIPLLLVI
jgi:hypothetical protein